MGCWMEASSSIAVPVSVTFCALPGTPLASSTTLSVSEKVPKVLGWKLKTTLQLPPGWSVPPLSGQVLAAVEIGKSVCVGVPTGPGCFEVMLTMSSGPGPELDSTSVNNCCGLPDIWPKWRITVPKSCCGTDQMGGPGTCNQYSKATPLGPTLGSVKPA